MSLTIVMTVEDMDREDFVTLVEALRENRAKFIDRWLDSPICRTYWAIRIQEVNNAHLALCKMRYPRTY